MAGTWNTFSAPTGVSADTMILLTDGSVLIHNADFPGAARRGGKDWYRLSPASDGTYGNNWSTALNMSTGRQFFASGVLRDGSVFVIGGEYSNLFPQDQCPTGEIFDPASNSWSALNKPTPFFDYIEGDCPSCVLSDGRVLIGGAFGVRTAIWDPVHDSWTEAGLGFKAGGAQTKTGNCDEESWALMPDNTVLAVSVANPGQAQKYDPSQDKWVATAAVQNLVVSSIAGTTVDEIGPSILLPDGRMFAIGGNGRTALYTPGPAPGDAGSWANGPNFPADTGPFAPASLMTAIDAPAVLLPGGKVLCVAGKTYQFSDPQPPQPPSISYWSNPTTFFLYDPAAGTLTQEAHQPLANGEDTWTGCLLLLPNGNVLYSNETNTIATYVPDAADLKPQEAWRPTLTNPPTTLQAGQAYTIRGVKLNGMSQASVYGDDRQNATNFPLVRLTDTVGKVTYLATSSFSTMGVATGTAIVTAAFQVPSHLQPGTYSLVAIVNAIASAPVKVQVT